MSEEKKGNLNVKDAFPDLTKDWAQAQALALQQGETKVTSKSLLSLLLKKFLQPADGVSASLTKDLADARQLIMDLQTRLDEKDNELQTVRDTAQGLAAELDNKRLEIVSLQKSIAEPNVVFTPEQLVQKILPQIKDAFIKGEHSRTHDPANFEQEILNYALRYYVRNEKYLYQLIK